MKIGRTIIDGASGKPMHVDEVLAIDIRPGWKDGTKVTFQGKGNEAPGQPPGDVVFVVKEQKHPRLAREGNDLTYTARIALKDALCGGTVPVEHPSGARLPVAFAGPIAGPHAVVPVRCAHGLVVCCAQSLQVPACPKATGANDMRVCRGKGMPVSKTPGAYGDLRVKFDVVFPTSLTDAQKEAIRKAW